MNEQQGQRIEQKQRRREQQDGEGDPAVSPVQARLGSPGSMLGSPGSIKVKLDRSPDGRFAVKIHDATAGGQLLAASSPLRAWYSTPITPNPPEPSPPPLDYSAPPRLAKEPR